MRRALLLLSVWCWLFPARYATADDSTAVQSDVFAPGGPGDTTAADVLLPDTPGLADPATPSVHCYPNPFVRSWGHCQVTFAGLTGRTRVRVFDASGFPMYDHEFASTGGAVAWDARNDGGQDLPAGFYFYVVTGETGQVDSGVLVVAQ